MSGLFRPKFELHQAFMPVLVTSNFDDDSIKNERASMETLFSHYNSNPDTCPISAGIAENSNGYWS